MSRRVIYSILLCCGVLLAGTGAATLAQSGAEPYQRVLDLTFPVPGAVEFTDDYHAARGGGRAHRGTDVFAPMGTPVHAVASGTVSWLPDRHPTAGYSVHVRGPDGLLYAYYHLGPHGGTRAQAYAPGLAEGALVRRGQLIGYLGDSGNAAGGRPHLHLEIHDDTVTDPYGTHRLNPYPSLLAAQQRGDTPSQSGSDVLRPGDRGPHVAAWQAQLNTVRDSPIAVDGHFGPETEQATRTIQQAAGITVDGIVGPETRAAVAPTAPVAAVLLRLGDRGPAVASWQSLLNTTRSTPIAVDGDFGPQTDQATRSFQQTAGITVDGIVGPQTWAAAGG